MSTSQHFDSDFLDLPVPEDISTPVAQTAGVGLVPLRKAGYDKHKHQLLVYRCRCGNEFTARRDNVQAGSIKHCSVCSVRGRSSYALVVPPIPPQTVLSVTSAVPDRPSSLEPPPTPTLDIVERTADVIKAELGDNGAALQMMERDIVLLSRLLAKEGVQPAGLDGDSTAKRFRETITTANYARKERKRLERELRELLNQKPVVLNASESVLARARKRSDQK